MDGDKQKAKASFKDMGLGEKVGHIAQYYWIQIVIAVVAIGILVSVIGHFTFNKPPEGCLKLGFRSEFADPNAIDALPNVLAEQFPEMTEGGEKVFVSNEFYAGYRVEQQQENEATLYKLAGSIAAGEVDVLIGDLDTLEREAAMNTYKDLRTIFTEEELIKLNELATPRTKEGEGVVYVSYDNVGLSGRTESQMKDVPMLICIAGGNEAVDACLAGDVGYLAVVNNAANIDNVKTFIWKLLGENVD